MPQININHAFVSTKPDSPDASLVSSSEWNSPELVTGGIHGQLLIRDGASPTGIGSVAGPIVQAESDSYTGSAPSPVMGAISVNMSTPSKVILTANMSATVSDSTAAQGFIYRDGVIVHQFNFSGTAMAAAQVVALDETAGPHTYHVQSNLGSGTFTLLTTILVVFAIGAA